MISERLEPTIFNKIFGLLILNKDSCYNNIQGLREHNVDHLIILEVVGHYCIQERWSATSM